MTERPRRRWSSVVLAIIVGLVALVVVAPTLLSTSAGNQLLLRAVNQRLAGSLTAERVSFGWLGGLQVRGLVLKDARGRPILDAPRLDTQLTLLEVLRDPLPLGRSRLDVASLRLVSYPDGTTNLSRSLRRGGKASGGASTPRKVTGRLALEVTEVRWSKPGEPGVRLSGLTGTMDLNREHVKAELASALRVPGMLPSRLRAHVDVTLADDALTVRRTSFLEEGPPKLGNRLELTQGSRLSFGDADSAAVVHVRYDLQRLAKLLAPVLPEGLSLRGRHTTTLRLHGRLRDAPGLLRLRDVTLAPALVAYERLAYRGVVLTNGAVPVALRDGRLSFGDAKLRANGGTLTLAGHIDLTGREPVYVLTRPSALVRSVNINTELANGPLKFLPVSWGATSEGKVDGTLTARLERASVPLSRRGLAERGSFEGEVIVDDLDATSPGIASIAKSLGPVGRTLTGGDVEVHDQDLRMPLSLHDGRLRFEGVEVQAGALDLSFSGSVGVDGTLDADSRVKVGGFSTPARVAIGGTVKAPEVSLQAGVGAPDPGKALEQAPDAIRDVFEGLKP